jgi:hypothetical protein
VNRSWAIALCCVTALIAPAASSASAPSPATQTAGYTPCQPRAALWYDSDQFGTYPKLSFKIGDCGISANLTGEVWCTAPELKKLKTLSTEGATPRSTGHYVLPAWCKRFRAYGDGTILLPDSTVTWSDQFAWPKGKFPA